LVKPFAARELHQVEWFRTRKEASKRSGSKELRAMVTTDPVVDTSTDLSGHFDVIIIGAGQAGLATGYYLAREGLRFVILDQRERVGDIWRSRWDSLRLFTPARYDGLPGVPFPAKSGGFPSRDQVADYLESYATRMALPVRTRTHVDGIWPARDGKIGYIVTAGDAQFTAAQVVVATGADEGARIPDFAGELDPGIRQFHSSEYRNPSQFQTGDVLVVGAGNSGAEIALEAAREHRTILAGRHPGHVPFRIDGRIARSALPGLWFVANRVLTLATPMGRRVAPAIRSGHAGPLVRVKPSDLAAAGVERTYARVAGVQDGKPVLDDGRVLDVANVVWCTGFRNDFTWIHLPVLGDDGYPLQERGVSESSSGLYFAGLPFMYAFASMLLGGVGRDAAHIASRIAGRAKAAA
jgi:putative flavoprotein involved in K+ transport